MRQTKVALLLAALAACQGRAWAAEIEADVIVNPPVLGAAKLLKAGAAAAPRRLNLMRQAPMQELSPGVPREVELNLAIQYVNGWIRNPALDAGGLLGYDKVSLRSYVEDAPGSKAHSVEPGNDWGPRRQTPFVAPQIETFPGQTVRVTLNNNLPFDPECVKPTSALNMPHCFNGTNLHAHGLWVNPAGNSDNVMISINPGVGFQYEYNIPPTHPAGTFWYHTHRHGSTALQVSSGMAGPLIVRGTRAPTETENGDIDMLLKPFGATRFPERVMMFQQIQYACRYPNGKNAGMIKTYGDAKRDEDPPVASKDYSYLCAQGDVGRIEGYDQLTPGSWKNSGRYTSINGVVMGKLVKAKAGVVERWRMIHGGVRDSIALKIRRLAADAPPFVTLKAKDTEDYVDKYCTGPELDQSVIAADGLTLAKVMRKKTLVFQPAYRWDALIVFPTAGNYCLVNDYKKVDTIERAPPSARLLGVVEVEGGAPVEGDAQADLQRKLIAAAQANFAGQGVKDKVVAELKNGLGLGSFVPHASVADDELTGTQTMTFNIDNASNSFQVDGKAFAGGAPDRSLPLGGVEQWTLTSDFVSHPFHIHVNPFQVVKILAPDGTDISGENGVDPDGDTQYAGLKGVWKDTIWVKNLFASNNPPQAKAGRYTVVVRTRYERYIGDFVLHCHILDHEDQGMMQSVRVVLPDGAGGTAHGHH